MRTTRNQIEVKCCCLVCWKLGLKGQNYSTQSNLIQSGLKGHSYHFLHPSHLFNINMYNMYCKHYYKRVQSSYLSQISQIRCGEILGDFGRFCHNLCAFMWRKIEPKKYICGEKMTNMRSARAVNIHQKKAFVNGDNVPRLEVSDKNQSRKRIDMTK